MTLVLGFLAMCGPLAWAAPLSPAETAFFEAKIRPVLVEHCYRCHSAEAKKLRAGLLLDTRDGMRRGGESGSLWTTGKAAGSLLLKALRHEGDLQMPPESRLPAAVVADFAKWIEMGAPDPREGKAAAAAATIDFARARKEHWAFQPFKPIEPAAVKNTAWVRSPIDAFILQKLEAKKLMPAAEADPLTWLRRVSLDLIGLPPSPDEQHAFLKAVGGDREKAMEAVVERLLASPHYGERWGRHWLDVARYAETKGYERDNLKPFSWRYRDWVIEAFNGDMPYDRFVTEQLAGDETPSADSRSQLGTIFLTLGPFDTIAGNSEQARYDHLDDVVGTTASAFLGMTLQCARCHDHKFEPLSQKDYYRVLAVFAPMKIDAEAALGTRAEFEAIRKANEETDAALLPLYREWSGLVLPMLEKLEQAEPGKKQRMTPKQAAESVLAIKKGLEPATAKAKEKPHIEAFKRELQRVEEGVRDVATPEQQLALKTLRAQVKKLDDDRLVPQKAPIYSETFAKGSKAATPLLIRGDVGKRGPEVAMGLPEALDPGDFQPPIPTETSSGRRLWLSRWITGQAHPLAARVMANRIWHYHFGQGFLLDGNNLGLQGGTPTHPELLEWLAQDFVRGGWTIKRMHRQIVLSATYRQGAATPHEQADPDNKLFSRWSLHRLESEAIRDSILAASGKLNRKMLGPSIYPPLESKVVGDSTSDDWKVSPGDDVYRRSIYVFSKRAIPLPELGLLGLPDPAVSTAQRQVSTTPVQSLLLLNSKFADQQARFFAERVRQEAGAEPEAQVKHAFSLALGRPPRDQEVFAALAFLNSASAAAPASTKTGPALAPLDRLAAFCLVLFNTNEFVYSN